MCAVCMCAVCVCAVCVCAVCVCGEEDDVKYQQITLPPCMTKYMAHAATIFFKRDRIHFEYLIVYHRTRWT